MPQLIFLLILTLVGAINLAHARPHEKGNLITGEEQKKSSNEVEKVDLDKENLNLSQPSKTPPKTNRDYYYPYTRSLSPMLSFGVDTNKNKGTDEEKDESSIWLLGVNYLLHSYRSPHWEVGVDISTNSTGFLSYEKRWISNERSSFRPYYKLGGTLQLVGNEGLATFTKFDNYFLSAALGLEDFLKAPMSLRGGFRLLVGSDTIIVFATFGYSWGW